MPVRPERFDTDPLSQPITPLAPVRIQKISLIVVAVVAFVAAAWVASELWTGLLLGVLTAFALEPFHRRLLKRFPRRRNLTAAATVTGVALIVAALLGGFFYMVGQEAIGAVAALQAEGQKLSPDVLRSGPLRLLAGFGVTEQMLAERVAKLTDRAAEIASTLVSGVVGSAFHWVGGALIAMVTAYYTLKDRRPIEHRMAQLLPLNPRATRELIGEFRKVGRGTLIGSALAGLVQGAFATVGYAIAGVPRPVLLGALTAVASLVPVFGTLLVWVPVGLVLIFTGHLGAGIFQLAWSVLITTTLVDYVLRPMLAGRESRSHPLLFLIGLIGGVEVFGGAGIIAGPIVMAFFASVLRIYRREVVEPARREGV
jgi:predicted PurR-regulated permease PerM